MNVIFCVLRDVVVYSFEFVEHVLDCLHEHGFQRSRKRIRIIGVVFFQRYPPVRLRCAATLLARLSLKDKLADGVDIAGRRRALCGGVVFFADIMQDSADSVSDRVFCTCGECNQTWLQYGSD